MQRTQARTSGTEALDTLIDGVQVGDNLVVVVGDGLSGEWLVDRFSAAADPARLVIADATGRHADHRDASQVLHWSSTTGDGVAAPAEARAALAAADRRVGTDAAFAFDSLSALAQAWGDQSALDLFLWACPRLYRRRSVALWLVDGERHDDTFLRRLTEITQVVVMLRATDSGVRLEVAKADGRTRSVLGRTLDARLVDGDLVEGRAGGVGRRRLAESLRAVRTSRGVGQAELARRVGISPSALSQAERGVRGVSSETLTRIWETLGVPFGPDDPLARGYRVNRRGAQSASSLAVGVTGRQLSDAPTATVWQLLISPRATGRGALFAVKAAETITVLTGVLQVDLAHGSETLHEGDTLVADQTVITGWTNPSDTDTEVIWIIAG